MAQHGVAGGMAVAVVDGLEVVGVDEQYRQRPWCAAPALQFQFGRVEQGASVGQARQVVAADSLAHGVGGVAAVTDVADDQAVADIFRRPCVRRMQRRDQAAAPEAAAIGAQKPAFVEAPADAVGLEQTVRHALGRDGIGGIEQAVGSALGAGLGVARDALHAGVPFLQAALTVQRHQRVIGQAGDDGVQPGLVLTQFTVAHHLLGDVAQHGHDAARIQFQQRQRQMLHRPPVGRIQGHAQLQAVANLAVRRLERGHALAQVGCHCGQCGEQVVQAAIARQRHQQLRAQRVDHQDFAVQPCLHQPDRGQVQKLDQRFVVFLEAGVHVYTERCTST